ncbi:DUF421 domain-containing protein [Dethiobacter alkaliphilus]|uniref:DUF421 domain-containing protein n=1 Tax=Dethiobacter alkaliphilus TaxID=427926 RepID=UPI00222636B9|nr:DUF421 domain-containing protein [Dethiobacter alkaliphilus]MCW3489418.1 DUF421 domain-containing protein [Dethiobacter alkaliphilus]
MEVVNRAIIVYAWSLILLRLMGKGLTFQQKPYDFVVMMLIGSASAAMIVNRDVPLINALVALGVLALMHTVISLSTLNNLLKGFIGGRPDLVIRNGRIVKQNLIKNAINVEQLMAALRNQGYRRIHDIEFAILEPNGQLSVIPKSQVRPVTPQDLQISTVYEGIATPLVVEGQVLRQNLFGAGLDENWLKAELTKRGIRGTDAVLLLLLDTDGSLYIAEQPPINPFKAFFVGEGKDKEQSKDPDM